MSDTSASIFDWQHTYRQSLTTEILRSEQRRATILATLFVLAASVYTVFAYGPSFVDAQLRSQLQARWPSHVSLHALFFFYEWFMRGAIGRRIDSGRQPSAPLRYLNALVETSIPTALLFIANALMGPRDALGSPAFLLYFFFILLSILQLDARLCWFTGLVAGLEHLVFAYIVIGGLASEPEAGFWRLPIYHFNRSLSLLVAGVVAGLLAQQIRNQVEKSVRSVLERDRAVRIFGQYVSPQIAEKLLKQPVELAGELRHVCVMFLDIRDFSSYAASARPEAVMTYLNRLFDFMIDIVNAHQGIVNKFLGDGFMAVFGAPIDDAEPCVHAVDASRKILVRLDELNAAGTIHLTRVGIGLHMGEAVTGNVGSSERKEYTIIGDVVNLAARLEQATKEFNARLLISDVVRQNLAPAVTGIEDLGWVELKGQANAVRVFKLA